MTLYRNRQRFVGGLQRFGIFALVMALFIGMAHSANAAGPYTVVTPVNPDGWAANNLAGGATVAITSAQPRGDVPNNLGSLEFTSPSGAGKADYVKYWPTVTDRTLGNLSELSFDLRRTSGSTAAQHLLPAFRLFYQTASNETGYLVWEDVYNGGSTSTPVPTDQWIAKDIFSGNFWMRAFGPSRTVEQYDVTLAEWKSGIVIPNAQILGPDTKILGIEVGVGSGWNGTFTGYVDNVAASFGADSVTANFEPAPVVVQCTTTCYVNGTTGSDSNGGASAGDAKQTIQAALNQVSPNGTVIIAAGTYNESTTITKDGLTVQGAGKGLTIIQGNGTTCNTAGVALSGARSNITLEDFSVTGFLDGIQMFTGPLTNIVVEDVAAVSNCRHGVWSQAFGINGLRFTRVTASSNNLAPNGNLSGRGIWIINGVKQNITIEDSVFNNNRLVGVDVSDGNVTGLTITGNEVTGNGDSGIGVLGAKGPGANLVSNNTVTNNGRFGIEIKNSTGSGSDSGAGSLVVSSNTVSRNIAATNAQDHAGILVMRRAPIAANNDDQPTGTVVVNNEVRGYHRAAVGSTGDGFGIVVEGLNNTVKNNIVTDNDVGIQVQGGNTANLQNTDFFDRGDAAQGGALVNRNSIAGNSIGLRTVGTISPTPLDATNNWWGSNSGPTNAGNPGGTGDSVVGANVDYDPWLCSGTDDQPATTGFQTSATSSPCIPPPPQCTTTCYVNGSTGSDANGGASPGDAKQTIQAALNQVLPNGTVIIAAGTYNESTTITKDGLTVQGAGKGQTIIQGDGVACNTAGVALSGARSNITLEDLTVTGFLDGIQMFTGPLTNIVLEDVEASNNCRHGIYVSQPNGINGMRLTRVDASSNNITGISQSGRGIWLIGSAKQNMTVEDSTFNNNRLVGLDFGNGTVTGLAITGNTVTGNGDSGIGVLGAQGPDANLVTGNTVTNNGRFGIEIKNSTGNGSDSGAGSLLVSNNVVSRTAAASAVSDYAGILVMRRAPAADEPSQPTGTVVANNEVRGYHRAAVGSTGDGFGIVVEGLNNVVKNNIVTDNDVGIQVQGGNTANTQNTDFFDRGDAAQGGALVNRNSIAGNGIGLRTAGVITPTPLDATNNWWGSNSGPTNAGNPGGTGDSVVGANVDYDPWLCNGSDDQPATTGFQTSATSSPCIPPPPQCTTTCYVNGTTGSDSNGGASAGDAKQTIQAAVNQVSPNGTVIIAAGTYPEQVTINKDGLTIQGAGSGQTIIQGSSCTGNGITLVGTRNGLTIEDLSVTGFENGIYLGVIGDTQINITIEDVNASANCRHGIISQDGVITNLSVNRVTASNNGFPNSSSTGSPGRGIWIINGIKTNISITNGTFSNNFITGIDFGDGNVTGLTVTGNTVEGNGDAGISVLGAKGPGANVVDSNIVRNNARFGIEVKASTGSGADSGAGSLVISRNIVERTVAATDLRDYAGIAVINRSGNPTFNDPQPSGAVVANNEVRGYHRAPSGSTGDGFGIVIEGLNNTVKNNIVTNNDVGIQVQGGNTANTQGTNFFDRGDAALGDAVVSLNSIAGNGIGLRTVRLPSDTPILNAERNWWGSNSGPQPTGSGDSVAGNVDYDPWLCSGQDTSAATGFQPNLQTSPCTPPVGTLTVTKYNDLNRNHVQDSGEPGLSGWKITVKQGATTITSGTTNGSGSVSFTSLTPGSYTVCETQQSGWQNTDPSDGSGCKAATVTAGNTTNVVLGNAQQSLTVIKYNDLNRNGMQDSGEPGLSGWKITVKRGSNLVASGTTGSNGSITFTGLAAGSYMVCETQQSGWQNTDPSNGSGCKTVTVTATGATTVLLGNAQQRGSITVTKYNDLNHNGTKDKNEPTLSGWLITVLQGTTVVASGTTGSNGTATFNNLPLGNYTVCETQQSGWQNTDPSNGSGCKPVTVTVNCSLNVLFGNASIVVATGTLKVTKYNDLNRNGKRDSGEAGLSGWTITVSQGATISASGVTNANGEVSFTLAPGSYKVCETKQTNWQNTDPSDGSGCKTVTVTKNSTATLVLGNAPAPSNPAPAQPGKIYAINDGGVADSQLFTVNLSSPKTVAALGPLYKGYDLEGLDIHPTTRTIYVTSGGDNAYGQRGWLYKVDGMTGALTPIGSTGQKEVEALAFAPNGELWGWAIGKGLIKINLTSGASTLIFADSKDVEGLAFSNDGSKVYAASGKKLYVYTVATGKIIELAANLPGMTEALEMRPDGTLLLGVDGSKLIYVYDPVSKQVITAQSINVAPYSDVEGIGYSAS